jgi:ATP-dependent RNA helicase DHX29
MLERPEDFQDITHVVLDEVHERTIDSDFLLVVLRRLMQKRPDLKLILMSATLEAQRFSNYLGGVPVMNIPGRTFPVEMKYLEDAVEMTGYRLSEDDSNGVLDDDPDEVSDSTGDAAAGGLQASLEGYSKQTRETILNFDEYRMDYQLIKKLLLRIATEPEMDHYSKAILVFMPGLAEIRRLNDEILAEPTFQKGWIVHALHSSIASEDQEKAFNVPPEGTRKIVIATNIAETGITIPDITAVVDSGKEKMMRFDERRQLSRLVESFISRANAKQRRGRAGRVQNGICFHLFTKHRHDKLLAEQQTPELLRLSLQDLVLRVKICKLGEVEQTLLEALDPPSPKNIRRAIDSLKEVKALTSNESLTPLGSQLAKLPLDVFLGKLIIHGAFFRCLDAAVSIAAILSSKSPFVNTMGSNSQRDAARNSFQRGMILSPTHLTIINHFQVTPIF